MYLKPNPSCFAQTVQCEYHTLISSSLNCNRNYCSVISSGGKCHNKLILRRQKKKRETNDSVPLSPSLATKLFDCKGLIYVKQLREGKIIISKETCKKPKGSGDQHSNPNVLELISLNLFPT